MKIVLILAVCTYLIAAMCNYTRADEAANETKTSSSSSGQTLIFPPKNCSLSDARGFISRYILDGTYGNFVASAKELRGNGYNWKMWAVFCEYPVVSQKRPQTLRAFFLVEAVGAAVMAKADRSLKNGEFDSDFETAEDGAKDLVSDKAATTDTRRLAKAFLAEIKSDFP
jgi:hypothetical protein